MWLVRWVAAAPAASGSTCASGAALPTMCRRQASAADTTVSAQTVQQDGWGGQAHPLLLSVHQMRTLCCMGQNVGGAGALQAADATEQALVSAINPNPNPLVRRRRATRRCSWARSWRRAASAALTRWCSWGASCWARWPAATTSCCPSTCG